MASFRPEALIDKLGKLNATQQSIETISQWCIFFRKASFTALVTTFLEGKTLEDAKKVVATWDAEFQKARDINKKLAMVYLANDILQNSRKKGPQFVNEFYHKLPTAVHQLIKHGDEKIRGSMKRMIKVWEERRVFGSSGAKAFTDLISAQGHKQPAAPTSGRNNHTAVIPALEPLWIAMNAVEEATARCRTLAEHSAAVLNQDTGSSSRETIRSGVQVLQQYAMALQKELGQREHVINLLRQIKDQQEEAKQTLQEQLGVCRLQAQQFEERLQNATNSAHPSAEGVSGAISPEDIPLPENDSSHVAMQRQPVTVGATTQTAEPDASTRSVVDQLLAGVNAQPSAGEPSFSAADLVAQLSNSGTSAQMLLDALAALPKDGAAEAGMYPAIPAEEEEEYDPEAGM